MLLDRLVLGVSVVVVVVVVVLDSADALLDPLPLRKMGLPDADVVAGAAEEEAVEVQAAVDAIALDEPVLLVEAALLESVELVPPPDAVAVLEVPLFPISTVCDNIRTGERRHRRVSRASDDVDDVVELPCYIHVSTRESWSYIILYLL